MEYIHEDKEDTYDSIEDWTDDNDKENILAEQPDIYIFYRFVFDPIYAVVWKMDEDICKKEFNAIEDANNFLKKSKIKREKQQEKNRRSSL